MRALNVNTVDEVPDSSWFTNRIGRRGMTVEEVVNGPDQLARVSLDGWVVSGGKGSGVQPGFRMTDPTGQLYQIEVDPAVESRSWRAASKSSAPRSITRSATTSWRCTSRRSIARRS